MLTKFQVENLLEQALKHRDAAEKSEWDAGYEEYNTIVQTLCVVLEKTDGTAEVFFLNDVEMEVVEEKAEDV